MDEKLFAHINNDAFLVGSHGLQGERFINTIAYLNKYITELNIQDPEILRLKDACNGLVEIERQLSLMMLSNNAADNLSKLSIEIANKIKDLKNEDYLLVPGGWVASNGGHAVVYQFYKDKDGNILFQINNSGSGVQFHEKRSSTSHELYNSVLTYKIPAYSATNVAIFSDILTKLLTLQIPILHRKAKITADVLYQEIIPLFSLGEAVEIQNKVHVELEKQHENEEEFFDGTKRERPYASWSAGQVKRFLLESMCRSHKRTDVSPIFTDNIKVSSNFAYSYTTQNKFLDMYLKPVHALLFKFEKNQLSCTILSQQDCEEIQETAFINGGWITTTHNTVLSGVAPPNITENTEYQQIMEQVKFFNGEFSSLLAQKTKLHWLTDNTAVKIDFFEKYLYKSRETLPAHLDAMKKRWGKTTKLYQFITTHFFTDKTQYYRNAALFSELDKQQKHEIDYLIDVCHKLSSEWEDLDLTKKDIYQENKLSLPAIGYLQCALEEVRKFKDLTMALCQNSTKQSIAAHLKTIPEMANCLAPNTSPNKIAHQLCSLMQRKGLGLSKHIMCFLAKDPDLTEEQLNSIFILAKTDNIARCRLLYNEKLILERREELHQIMLQDNNLTQDELEYLKNLAKNNKDPVLLLRLLQNKSKIVDALVLSELLTYQQSEHTIRASMYHPAFHSSMYYQLIQNAIKLKCGKEIATEILDNGNCKDFIKLLNDASLYKQLIDNKTIKDEHLVGIVQHSTNQEAFRTLLNRSQDDKLRIQIPEEKIAALLSNTKGNVTLHSKITCNSHYFFNNMSRDAKDSEINKKLRALNLDIACQDKARVQKSFKDIAKVVCTRRNKFASFFLGKYKTDTQSAENLLTKFSTNQDLLNLLDIKNQHIISAPLQLKHKMAESFIDDNKPCCFFRMLV